MTCCAIPASATEQDADAPAQFEPLPRRLIDEKNQRLALGMLEAMVRTGGGELLRWHISGYLDQRSVEEPIHMCVVGEDGVSRRHRREGRKRRLESCFGDVIVTRRGYGE